MDCLIASAFLLVAIVCIGMGGKDADGTPRTLVWAVAGALFVICAIWFGLAGLGQLK